MRVLRTTALAAIGLTILSLVFPFLEPGFRNGHDIGGHVTYAYLFNDAIRQGQFPVRWVQGPQGGYSQPLFNFYQVGLYYLVELVHLAVPRLSQSLTLTIALLWWTGSGFMFLWLKRLGALPAALGALMFAFAPYLIQDVFVRAAYAEVAAICMAPAVLWSLDRLLTTGRTAFVPVVAVSLGLMMICHLPATLIASPLFVANVGYLFLTKQAKPASPIKLAAAGVLALGLSAFYVIPALAELKYVNTPAMTAADADYHQHFILAKQLDGTRFGPIGDLSFQLGIGQWIAVILGPLVVVGAALRRRFGLLEAGLLLWLGVMGVALLMTNAVSLPVWESLPMLAFIQFPWRFFLLFSIAGAAAGAFLLALVRDRRVQAIVALIALGLHLPLYVHYQRPERLIPRSELDIDDPNWRYSDQARRLAFYQRGFDPSAVTRIPDTKLGRSTVSEGAGTLHEVSARNDGLTIDAETDRGMRVSINTHDFPGWSVRVDGRDAVVAVMPGYGFMLVDVPPGTHHIEARFQNTPIRTDANAVTLIAAAVLVVLLGATVFTRRGMIGRAHTETPAL